VLVEAAAESLDAALAAAEGGAHRIELCSNLAVGGTTPPLDLLRAVRSQLLLPIFVLVRPRAGDFVYTDDEHRLMLNQIEQAKTAGARGIVTGALTAQREIDGARVAELIRATRPLPFTFHRAIGACTRIDAALETLIRLGVDRVLTSGSAETAAEGAAEIASLVKQAAGRIVIMAGGGITTDNAARIVRETGVQEIHFSVKEAKKVRDILESL
jgi:copper homeostasis protein